MADPTSCEDFLLTWFESQVAPVLAEHGRSWVEDLGLRAEGLKRALRSLNDTSAVCFLGNSGVGKSTLINGLISRGEFVVPSGGVGPLTASALAVRHGVHPQLEVHYHPAQDVWQLTFALETALRRTGAQPQVEDPLEGSDLPVEAGDALTPPEGEVAAPPGEGEERYRRVAQLLVTGNQNAHEELQYLVDGLREITGNRRIWGTTARGEHVAPIAAAQDALALAKKKMPRVVDGARQNGQVLPAIHAHAAGNLAPLVMQMDVQWHSDVLRDGLVLVDLPGVGIAQDVHKEVTRKWIRERASAVALVVDHRGVTESVVELLRKSEFLNRLLYYGSENAGARPRLVIAVVRVDEIALTRWQQQTTTPKRSKASYFDEVCAEAEQTIREQLRGCLRAVWAPAAATDDVDAAKESVINALVTDVQIRALSATECRKIELGDPDDPSFLSSADQSRLPQLRQTLAGMASARHEEARTRVLNLSHELRRTALDALKYVEDEWASDRRVRETVEEVRRELDVVLAPRRAEFLNRQGEFRATLNKVIPARIDAAIATAGQKAQTRIATYLTRLGSAHWGTLRASVRREGRFRGAMDINLPHEFALRFEEPVAQAWSETILVAIRDETRAYASAVGGVCAAVLDWAEGQGTRVAQERVAAVRRKISDGTKDVDRVGRALVDDLRDQAQRQLMQAVEGPIKCKCQDFVKCNADVGTGVKQRILQLYSDLAGEVVEAAVGKSQEILAGLYREVKGEIATRFKGLENPLEDVREAILDSSEEFRKRSDVQRRNKVLTALKACQESAPAIGTEP